MKANPVVRKVSVQPERDIDEGPSPQIPRQDARSSGPRPTLIAHPGGIEKLVDELHTGGGNLAHVSADLADPDSPARLVATARAEFGRLDIVIANHARSVKQSLELNAAEMDLPYAINTRATLLLIKEFAAQLTAVPRPHPRLRRPHVQSASRPPPPSLLLEIGGSRHVPPGLLHPR